MRRLIPLGLLLGAGLGAALATAPTAPALAAEPARLSAPVGLNTSIRLDTPLIRVRDIFTGPLGRYANKPVAYAPKPGQRLILEADWLGRVAEAYDVDWRPVSRYDRAVVVRPGQVIGQDELLGAVRLSLISQGLAPEDELYLGQQQRISVTVAASADPEIKVLDAVFDPGAGQFTALVEVPAGSPEAERLTLTGRVFKTIEVPVLARSLRPGAVIAAGDLDWQRRRVATIDAADLTNPAEIVGQAARRALSPGQPLKARDLEAPRLIEKGDLVLIRLATAHLHLTTEGTALEDGAEGDTIRVRNSTSRQVVHGRVADHNLVVVHSGPGPQTAQR
ncbi:flagellar basal body P-ring formation chaperone FlgA [Roseospirillum parvum]|uniref:Flagella basal body P-ring formation protein FlgA n=1 Tax=Roseospirillum parvum TaxID=83401 RepID=A0A1G8FFW0_9PROT|nr:flagellar basal body P-ring formation chaperone FlgA [Roseospirillum parvum]SDH80899.1 flagella basal body P-ring formation protein FlgA [Roseospirillum parvum]